MEGYKVRQPGDTLRTRKQTVDDSPGGTVMDLSLMVGFRRLDIVAVTIVPVNPGTVEIKGQDDSDAFIPLPGGGVSLNIDFTKQDVLPKLRATAGSEDVNYLITGFRIRKHNG